MKVLIILALLLIPTPCAPGLPYWTDLPPVDEMTMDELSLVRVDGEWRAR